MTKETKTALRKFLLKKFPTNEYMDCPISTETQELIAEFAESLARERAINFAMIGVTRFENDGIEKTFERSYDHWIFDKTKEEWK